MFCNCILAGTKACETCGNNNSAVSITTKQKLDFSNYKSPEEIIDMINTITDDHSLVINDYECGSINVQTLKDLVESYLYTNNAGEI